jgi:hypothetical protein
MLVDASRMPSARVVNDCPALDFAGIAVRIGWTAIWKAYCL